MLVNNLFLSLINIEFKKTIKWKSLLTFFPKHSSVLSEKKTAVFFYPIFFFEKGYFLFVRNGGLSLAFFSILLQFFKKYFFVNGFFYLLFVISLYRIPFLLRAMKVAGRLYEVPMLTNLDSQYRLFFRVIYRNLFLKQQKSIVSVLVLLKLAFFREGLLPSFFGSMMETATANQRFLRFRW